MTTPRWTTSIILLLSCAVATLPAATLSISASPDLSGSAPGVRLDLTEETGTFVTAADGTSTWVGSVATGTFDLTWNLFFDPDPTVSGSLDVTNNTGATQIFSTSAVVPSTVALPAPAIMSGSSVVTVTDANGLVELSAPPGGAVYSGLIAGVPQRTLFDDPFTLSGPGGFVPEFAVDSFSGEPTITTLPVGGLLALNHSFLLAPGDTATVNGTFIVVPEPSTVISIVLAVVGVAACRRRSA